MEGAGQALGFKKKKEVHGSFCLSVMEFQTDECVCAHARKNDLLDGRRHAMAVALGRGRGGGHKYAPPKIPHTAEKKEMPL